MAQYSSLLRSLLRSYDGFECKEPDPGKFTLAFKTLHQAVYVGSVLQYELLRLEWEPMLLTVPRFRCGPAPLPISSSRVCMYVLVVFCT